MSSDFHPCLCLRCHVVWVIFATVAFWFFTVTLQWCHVWGLVRCIQRWRGKVRTSFRSWYHHAWPSGFLLAFFFASLCYLEIFTTSYVTSTYIYYFYIFLYLHKCLGAMRREYPGMQNVTKCWGIPLLLDTALRLDNVGWYIGFAEHQLS